MHKPPTWAPWYAFKISAKYIQISLSRYQFTCICMLNNSSALYIVYSSLAVINLPSVSFTVGMIYKQPYFVGFTIVRRGFRKQETLFCHTIYYIYVDVIKRSGKIIEYDLKIKDNVIIRDGRLLLRLTNNRCCRSHPVD